MKIGLIILLGKVETTRRVIQDIGARLIDNVNAHLLALTIHLVALLAVGIDLNVIHLDVVGVAIDAVFANVDQLASQDVEFHFVASQLLDECLHSLYARLSTIISTSHRA